MDNRKRTLILLMLMVFVAGCASKPPREVDNLCAIFDEKSGWYKAAKRAQDKWQIPIATNMAFMYQESRFVRKAKPPRTKILWIFPGPRKSSAYGYSQAKTDTWKWYIKSSGNRGADRDNFKDAVDFVAWYNRTSVERAKIPANDTYRLYLAYHEGHGGFKRGSFNKKGWLKGVAKKVANQAAKYDKQLKSCESRFKSKWWWPF